MNNIILIEKEYKLWDFVSIPFKICPMSTTIKILNKIINALIPSFQVLVTAKFIDIAILIFNGKANYSSIFTPLILFLLIVLYGNLNWSLMSFVDIKYEMKMTQVFRSAVVEKRSKLDYRHIENNDTWNLITRTCGDPVGRISGGLDNLMGGADILIRVFSLLVILMTKVWWVSFVVIAITVPLYFISIKGGKEAYDAHKEAEKLNRRGRYIHDVLSNRDNVEERTLFGYTDNLNKKWHKLFEDSRKLDLQVNLKYFIRMKSSSLITVVISIFIIGILLFPLERGEISSGLFMGLVPATLGLSQMMSWQLSHITFQLSNNREYLKDLTAFCALTETEGALDLPWDSKDLRFESIEFKNVSFKYPGIDKYILKDFSLRLEKNLHYAFVGVNGAGKTTITKLLTGMYDNFEGEILINNRSIRDYELSQLKALFSVVYQDFAKYYITMKDNIGLGNVLIQDNTKIEEAAATIELDSAIEKLPNGIDTYLGKIKENAVDLSGGEWQRIAIARSIYSTAQIRILDEPTASLDPFAESNIYEMFGRISAGKSTIFITHRLGAVRLADEIIVIDEGRVAEKGTHDALMALGGIYSEMFESQRSWYN